jgi:uncharacterized protein YkwD
VFVIVQEPKNRIFDKFSYAWFFYLADRHWFYFPDRVFNPVHILFFDQFSDDAEAKIFLDHHNKVRAEVGVGKLAWSSSLSNYAQSWANELADKKCKMKHSECRDETGRVLGENIFWGSSSAVYGTLDASKFWYEEKADYNGERIGETRGKKVGHYTQMVWKYTREVGAGVAYCPSGAIIVVASYHPAGNIVGSVPY